MIIILIITSSVTINCTRRGAIIEQILDTLLVIPINVLAWLGERSMWLIWKPQYVAELAPTAMMSRPNASPLSSGLIKVRPSKARAGTHKPENLTSFVC